MSETDKTAESVRRGTTPERLCGNSDDLLSEDEIELLRGMIEVQKDHASRCLSINNRVMADKQRERDFARVRVLEKCIYLLRR